MYNAANADCVSVILTMLEEACVMLAGSVPMLPQDTALQKRRLGQVTFSPLDEALLILFVHA